MTGVSGAERGTGPLRVTEDGQGNVCLSAGPVRLRLTRAEAARLFDELAGLLALPAKDVNFPGPPPGDDFGFTPGLGPPGRD